MEIMKEAFFMAALHYINFTHFDYDLEFYEDQAIGIAIGHFLYHNKSNTNPFAQKSGVKYEKI